LEAIKLQIQALEDQIANLEELNLKVSEEGVAWPALHEYSWLFTSCSNIKIPIFVARNWALQYRDKAAQYRQAWTRWRHQGTLWREGV